jgi:hypothetical protein
MDTKSINLLLNLLLQLAKYRASLNSSTDWMDEGRWKMRISLSLSTPKREKYEICDMMGWKKEEGREGENWWWMEIEWNKMEETMRWMGEMNSIREKGDECLGGFENNLKT